MPARKRLAGPYTPRLVASQSSAASSMLIVMADLLEPGDGKVEFAEAFAAYKRECRRRGRPVATPDEFSAALERLCRQTGIRITLEGDLVYLARVQLKVSEASRNAAARQLVTDELLLLERARDLVRERLHQVRQRRALARLDERLDRHARHELGPPSAASAASSTAMRAR